MFAFGETLFAPSHILILLVVGILVFGKRLPEVGRYLGKGIVEFKKGLKGLEDDIEGSMTASAPQQPAALQPPPAPPQRVAPTAPKFEDNAGTVNPPQV